jgi:hypothetical protein
MPWLQSVQVTSATGGAPRVYDCLASAADPKQFSLPEEKGSSRCEALAADGANGFRFAKPAQLSANFLAQYYTLDPGTNHALCAVNTGRTHCELFSVEYPFFQYRPQTSGTTPAPYFLSEGGAAGPGAAVFGVVDPSLTGLVGQLDGAWRNEDRRFDSTIAVTDPVDALRQVLGLCAADPHCQGRRKILLAQMPRYRAAELASKFPSFDVVIAQADGEHANGEEFSSKTISAGVGGGAYLLTPGLTFDTSRPTVLSTNLRRADLYATADQAKEKREFLANRVFDRPLPGPAGNQQCQGCVYTAAVTQAARTDYGTLALTAMRQFCGSDVALLQDRDLFTGAARAVALWPRDESYTAQEILDEVLWKGDFVFCMPVKGSTLRKVLADSNAFAK